MALVSVTLPRALVPWFTLLAWAGSQPAGGAAGADDRVLSAGRWRVVAAVWDGTPVEQDVLARLDVIYRADGSWAVLLRRTPVAEGRSTNRQDVAPKTFEMETLGSEGIKPARYTGIYRLDGDTCVLCMVPAGMPRPDEFAAPRHSGRMLVTLERVGALPGGQRR
jgi:uncharacterized protein (TIGR03067 family)